MMVIEDQEIQALIDNKENLNLIQIDIEDHLCFSFFFLIKVKTKSERYSFQDPRRLL